LKPISVLLEGLDFLLDGLDLLDRGEGLEFELVALLLPGRQHREASLPAELLPRFGIDVSGLRPDYVHPLAHHLPLREVRELRLRESQRVADPAASLEAAVHEGDRGLPVRPFPELVEVDPLGEARRRRKEAMVLVPLLLGLRVPGPRLDRGTEQ